MIRNGLENSGEQKAAAVRLFGGEANFKVVFDALGDRSFDLLIDRVEEIGDAV